ncbi:MAG: hypothetical protein R3D58_15075 [Saprospiraceae bacterium]
MFSIFLVAANYFIPENDKPKTRNAPFTSSFSGISSLPNPVTNKNHTALPLKKNSGERAVREICLTSLVKCDLFSVDKLNPILLPGQTAAHKKLPDIRHSGP